MIKISKTSWHYRFIKRTHDKWMPKYSDLDLEEYHNLCPYLRAVFIWAPLAWIVFPIYRGWTKMIYLLFDGIDWIYMQYAKRVYIVIDGKIVEVTKSNIDSPYAFWYYLRIKPPKEKVEKVQTGTPLRDLVMDWLEARHDKVCPMVEFVEEEKP